MIVWFVSTQVDKGFVMERRGRTGGTRNEFGLFAMPNFAPDSGPHDVKYGPVRAPGNRHASVVECQGAFQSMHCITNMNPPWVKRLANHCRIIHHYSETKTDGLHMAAPHQLPHRQFSYPR